MQLVMYIGNDFIASLPVNADKITSPGYVGELKRELIEGNHETLAYTSCEPEFWVVNFSHTAYKAR
jgi:hypothetical protein